MSDKYESIIRKEINKISPNLYDNINKIESCPKSNGIKVLQILIEYACLGQNMSPILIARRQMKKIPIIWLEKNIPNVVMKTISLRDDWEYRRLLELLTEISPSLLVWAIKEGENSVNEEVREVVDDFKNCSK